MKRLPCRQLCFFGRSICLVRMAGNAQVHFMTLPHRQRRGRDSRFECSFLGHVVSADVTVMQNGPVIAHSHDGILGKSHFVLLNSVKMLLRVSRGNSRFLSHVAQLPPVAVTRHTVFPTSSAISSAPVLSTASPTGRPRAWLSLLRKPVTTSCAMPSGLPSLNGT